MGDGVAAESAMSLTLLLGRWGLPNNTVTKWPHNVTLSLGVSDKPRTVQMQRLVACGDAAFPCAAGPPITEPSVQIAPYSSDDLQLTIAEAEVLRIEVIVSLTLESTAD